MKIEDFIRILKEKKCQKNEKIDFVKTLSNEDKIFDILISYYSYEENLHKILKYIFKNFIPDINYYGEEYYSNNELYDIIKSYQTFATIGKIFINLEKYKYVVVDFNDNIYHFDKPHDIFQYLINIDFFNNISETDFQIIIDYIDNLDMFYYQKE